MHISVRSAQIITERCCRGVKLLCIFVVLTAEAEVCRAAFGLSIERRLPCFLPGRAGLRV